MPITVYPFQRDRAITMVMGAPIRSPASPTARPTPQLIILYSLIFPQILRGQHSVVAPGSGAGLGLRRPSKRGLRPPSLLHGHQAEPGVLQGMLLAVRLRARLQRPVYAATLLLLASAHAADLCGIAEESVGWDRSAKEGCEIGNRDAAPSE